ncbi:hypothetical protein [Methylobacterium nonmethylotrophicum]|uniref:Uncharacterized protein n=1 Tax=Methylobacterium nonmethylotrophicum TaxID=1141884 RepID=A0A4Z0NS49_9HYPH|nr:hypothetical protein [Methylobacterium nonmethylotrophicum]TGE00073.1 hypothetical protein EU555_09125 [Methylobacterium nonmethylotrophicum]
MGETEKPVTGGWDWLRDRVQPLDRDVEAALDEPWPEMPETPIEFPENWDWLRRLVGPLDDDFARAAAEQPPLLPDDAVEDDPTP